MRTKDELALLHELEAEKLLPNLVRQLNKDADLSGAGFKFEESVKAEQLVLQLYDFLLHFMTNDFRNYLSFLYRVDISENSLREIKEIEPKSIAEKVTFLVLKREWQKVSFRNKTR